MLSPICPGDETALILTRPSVVVVVVVVVVLVLVLVLVLVVAAFVARHTRARPKPCDYHEREQFHRVLSRLQCA